MKNLFVTGTGTDVGKTYVTDLIISKLRGAGFSAGYYKAAASGIEKIPAGKNVSYAYKDAVSPHLAAKLANRPIEFSIIERDFAEMSARFEFLTVEGSGGIICPLRWDSEHLLLEDLIQRLNLPVIIVALAGLGTINSTVLTVEHLRAKNIPVKGIILNRFHAASLMENDNAAMIGEMTGVPIIATVAENATQIEIAPEKLISLYK